MPLFEIQNKTLRRIEKKKFSFEKDLQNLIEQNLETVFNCRFVESEFSTGKDHAGRIDTLALSEDNNPVIIEYKIKESSDLVTQSLFYLHWIQDHKGDYEIAVQKALGNNVEVDWSDVRVICIAPNYKKYDLHAVQVMGANIELWKYSLFTNNSLYLEEVYQASKTSTSTETNKEGKKAYHTIEQHLQGKSQDIQSLFYSIKEYILGLDPAFQEAPKQQYIAYKTSQSIVWVRMTKNRLIINLKLEKDSIKSPPVFYRDVSKIEYRCLGNSEFKITNEDDFEQVKPFIELAYNKIGG